MGASSVGRIRAMRSIRRSLASPGGAVNFSMITLTPSM
jgi:hypothetical protein